MCSCGAGKKQQEQQGQPAMVPVQAAVHVVNACVLQPHSCCFHVVAASPCWLPFTAMKMLFACASACALARPPPLFSFPGLVSRLCDLIRMCVPIFALLQPAALCLSCDDSFVAAPMLTFLHGSGCDTTPGVLCHQLFSCQPAVFVCCCLWCCWCRHKSQVHVACCLCTGPLRCM